MWIKGVAYTLYPIHGTRGVSLCYITSPTNSVTLAVNMAFAKKSNSLSS